MSAMLLRDRLKELLVDKLGTYTLANGVQVPAIYCAEKADAWSNDRTVKGLEVITLVVPTRKYPVILKYWEVDRLAPGIDLRQVCDLIQQHLCIESFENIEIEEQPELRSVVKCVVNGEDFLNYVDDFLMPQ